MAELLTKLQKVEEERQELLKELARIRREEWERDEPKRKEAEAKRKQEMRKAREEKKKREEQEKEERRKKAEEERVRRVALEQKIKGQKIVVDALLKEEQEALAIYSTARDKRNAVMHQEIAKVTANLRKQLTDLEAETIKRLETEPESVEVDRLHAKYEWLQIKATRAERENQAACEFHNRKNAQEVLDCRWCCRASSYWCSFCGSEAFESVGSCRCNSCGQ